MTAQIDRAPSALELVASLLFSAPADTFGASPPRRGVTLTAPIVVAAGTGNQGSAVVSVADNIARGDALYFELLTGAVFVSGRGLTITDVELLIVSAVPATNVIIGQPIFTTLNPSTGTAAVFEPALRLLTADDMDQWANQSGQPSILAPAQQPLGISLGVGCFNGSAGALSFRINLFARYRVIHGVQEG